jgi:hypothetical protein
VTEPTPLATGEPAHQQRDDMGADANITCVKCGAEGIPLHRGCPMCEECCDCRPLGT